MSPRFAARLSLVAMLVLGGCVDGGSRGSGISTAVLGNIIAVQPSVTPNAASSEGNAADHQSSLQGIRVTVDGTGVHGRTDAGGNFTLRGNFEGLVTIGFWLPGGGGDARLPVNVPAAGQLTLVNVTVDTQSGEAYAETQWVAFHGIIVGIDCAALVLTMVSSHETAGDADQYRLQLDTSSVQNANGDPVACTALNPGDAASVTGTVNPDGSFGDATVVLQD